MTKLEVVFVATLSTTL